METLNVLYNIEEKQETRPLYEEVFPEDKGEFLDYYYEDRCRDNVIIDIKRENAVIAMAHFNPFTMETRDGRTFPVMYIYAVSTKKAERHKGYMRRILIEGFRIMTEKGISFCYLIPVDEAIYKPFGFETIGAFTKERIRHPEEIRRNYELFLREDADYQRRVAIEENIEKEQKSGQEAEDRMPGKTRPALPEREMKCQQAPIDSGLPEEPVLMAKILNREQFIRWSGLPENTEEKDMLAFLKHKKIYIAEEV